MSRGQSHPRHAPRVSRLDAAQRAAVCGHPPLATARLTERQTQRGTDRGRGAADRSHAAAATRPHGLTEADRRSRALAEPPPRRQPRGRRPAAAVEEARASRAVL